MVTGERLMQQDIEAPDQLATERVLSEDVVEPLRAHHRDRFKQIDNRTDGDDGYRKLSELYDEIELLLIAA
jgi:hypothetical protein